MTAKAAPANRSRICARLSGERPGSQWNPAPNRISMWSKVLPGWKKNRSVLTRYRAAAEKDQTVQKQRKMLFEVCLGGQNLLEPGKMFSEGASLCSIEKSIAFLSARGCFSFMEISCFWFWFSFFCISTVLTDKMYRKRWLLSKQIFVRQFVTR
jgi:hypothetical protein